MIFNTAYDTLACSGYKLDKIIAALKVAHISNAIEPTDTHNIYRVVGGSAEANAVPAFIHPIAIKSTELNISDAKPEDVSIFIDARSFGKIDIKSNEFVVRSSIDYTLLLTNAKLTSLWCNGKSSWLRDLSSVPMALYANWIGESVGRRFALDPKEQFDLTILAAICYTSLCNDKKDEDLADHDKLKIVNSVSRALRASTHDVIEIVDKIDSVDCINSFCKAAEVATGSVRLKELNPGVLFAILGGTWFSPNAKEIIAVATEHPPTWITMLVAVYTERSFKNSQLAKLTERPSYKKVGDDFVRAVMNVIRVTDSN